MAVLFISIVRMPFLAAIIDIVDPLFTLDNNTRPVSTFQSIYTDGFYHDPANVCD